jgi:hypothetical protein
MVPLVELGLGSLTRPKLGRSARLRQWPMKGRVAMIVSRHGWRVA